MQLLPDLASFSNTSHSLVFNQAVSMLVDKNNFYEEKVSLMSTSMAAMTYQLKISNVHHHIIELYINLCMNRTVFKINMYYPLSVPIMELCSKNHFVNT